MTSHPSSHASAHILGGMQQLVLVPKQATTLDPAREQMNALQISASMHQAYSLTGRGAKRPSFLKHMGNL